MKSMIARGLMLFFALTPITFGGDLAQIQQADLETDAKEAKDKAQDSTQDITQQETAQTEQSESVEAEQGDDTTLFSAPPPRGGGRNFDRPNRPGRPGGGERWDRDRNRDRDRWNRPGRPGGGDRWDRDRDRWNRPYPGGGYNRPYPGRYWRPYPGWREGWRWDRNNYRPPWYRRGISYPIWRWVIHAPVGYYQCTAFNEWMQPFTAIGPDVNQAAWGALYACGGYNFRSEGCYIPANYCRLRY